MYHQDQLRLASEDYNALKLANTTEKVELEKLKNEVETQIAQNDLEMKTLRAELEIAHEKLKLKDEEIYEIKENYERQIEDINLAEAIATEVEPSTPLIRLISQTADFVPPSPKINTTAVYSKEDKQRAEEVKKAYDRFIEYQDKVSVLTDEIFNIKNSLTDKNLNIQKLHSEINNKIIKVNQLTHEKEGLSSKLLEVVQENKAISSQIGLFKETQIMMQKQIDESAQKLELFKKELEAKSSAASTHISMDKQGSTATKLITRLMQVLTRSKKLHELKDDEISDLKKQLEEEARIDNN